MGKICWINGQLYLVSLPMGGRSPHDLNSPWDEMITFLGDDSNDLFHWKNMYSWCQERMGPRNQTVRGYSSARRWNCYYSLSQISVIGFRPVLAPLDPDTLKPDTSLLEDIPDGSRIALASLYMDGKVIAEPQNPTYVGDIVDYIPGAEISLGDRDKNPKNWLHVIKFRDLLWVDRNIVNWISWADLKNQGYVGKVA